MISVGPKAALKSGFPSRFQYASLGKWSLHVGWHPLQYILCNRSAAGRIGGEMLPNSSFCNCKLLKIVPDLRQKSGRLLEIMNITPCANSVLASIGDERAKTAKSYLEQSRRHVQRSTAGPGCHGSNSPDTEFRLYPNVSQCRSTNYPNDKSPIICSLIL